MRFNQFKDLLIELKSTKFIYLFTQYERETLWMYLRDFIHLLKDPYYLSACDKYSVQFLYYGYTGLTCSMLVNSGGFRKKEVIRLCNDRLIYENIVYDDYMGITLDGKVVKNKNFKPGSKNYVDLTDDELNIMINYVVNHAPVFHTINEIEHFPMDEDIINILILYDKVFQDYKDTEIFNDVIESFCYEIKGIFNVESFIIKDIFIENLDKFYIEFKRRYQYE